MVKYIVIACILLALCIPGILKSCKEKKEKTAKQERMAQHEEDNIKGRERFKKNEVAAKKKAVANRKRDHNENALSHSASLLKKHAKGITPADARYGLFHVVDAYEHNKVDILKEEQLPMKQLADVYRISKQWKYEGPGGFVPDWQGDGADRGFFDYVLSRINDQNKDGFYAQCAFEPSIARYTFKNNMEEFIRRLKKNPKELSVYIRYYSSESNIDIKLLERFISISDPNITLAVARCINEYKGEIPSAFVAPITSYAIKIAGQPDGAYGEFPDLHSQQTESMKAAAKVLKDYYKRSSENGAVDKKTREFATAIYQSLASKAACSNDGPLMKFIMAHPELTPKWKSIRPALDVIFYDFNRQLKPREGYSRDSKTIWAMHCFTMFGGDQVDKEFTAVEAYHSFDRKSEVLFALMRTDREAAYKFYNEYTFLTRGSFGKPAKTFAMEFIKVLKKYPNILSKKDIKELINRKTKNPKAKAYFEEIVLKEM